MLFFGQFNLHFPLIFVGLEILQMELKFIFVVYSWDFEVMATSERAPNFARSTWMKF